KWAYSIPSAEKTQEAVRKAFRVALTEPRGPVHLDASRDVYLDEVVPEAIEPAEYRPFSRPDCASADLDRAMELLARAERPLFVVGGGVLREGQTAQMQRLADVSE